MTAATHTGWSHWDESGELVVDRPGFRLQPKGWLSFGGKFYATWAEAQAGPETCFMPLYAEGLNE